MATTINNQAGGSRVEVSAAAVAELLRTGADVGEDGFAVIYRHYQPILVRYAAARGARDPESVANLALFDGYKALESLNSRKERSFRSYLFRAAANHVVAEHRRAEAAPAEIHEDLLIGGDIAEAEVDRLWLRNLVDELSPDQREVIESRFFLGLSGGQTAQRLGKSPNAVHQLQHRALRRLLRRITFAAVAVFIALAASWAAIQALGTTNKVDSSPADQVDDSSAETEDSPQPVPPVDATPDADDNATGGATLDRSDENSIEAGLGDGGPSPAVAEEPATGEEPAAGEPVEPEATGDGPDGPSEPEPVPAAEVAADQEPPRGADEEPDSGDAIPVVQPATRPNLCAVHQINPSLFTLKLYNPQSNAANAGSFVAPLAIRFLDGDRNVLDTVDTSGPMTNSAAAGSHGWIGDAPSTFAVYADAPPPTYWGVLSASPALETWTSIQMLDPGTGAWSPIAACDRP